MHATMTLSGFLRSRAGLGFITFALFCAALAAGVGYGTYSLALNWYQENKAAEKVTALQLVDAFVTNYSELRGHFPGSDTPVPATFRAHSIEIFNKLRGSDNSLRLLWVGRKNRSVATPPTDEDMAETIEAFAHEANPKPRSKFVTVGDTLVFRTVYPSIANQQSCLDCHNSALQAGQPEWRLNDVMGAFTLDVPASAFLRTNRLQSESIAFIIFILLAGVGLVISIATYRRLVEREAAQVRLKNSEQRFRDFAESTSDWFWEQDQNLRFTALSNAVETSGMTVAEHLGRTRREVVTLGVTEEQWQAHEADLMARRAFQNFRFQRQTPDGEIRHFSVSGKPFYGTDGRFRGYRGTAKDVTAEIANEIDLASRVETRTAELRAAQEELIRKERLSALGQLTATVAHELRNPLSAIRNSIFAVKEIATRHGLLLDRPLQRIERGISRCDRIIGDLLDYTRLRELRRMSLVADTWLSEVLDEQKIPEGVSLFRDLSAPGIHLDFDPERLRRVIVNLIENAAQALTDAPADGRERQIIVSTRTFGEEFEFAIADSGPGITAEILPKVFEPLFSTKNFGTGLGLPTVKQIVEQHGGSVWIASEPGLGTRVAVRLPLAPATEIAA